MKPGAAPTTDVNIVPGMGGLQKAAWTDKNDAVTFELSGDWAADPQGNQAKIATTFREAARIAELEREVRELRRANQILKSAASFFAAELDRPSR